jgi:hypothetical protein
MGGKTITVSNFTTDPDKSRDFFTKMVKVNDLRTPGRPYKALEGTQKI